MDVCQDSSSSRCNSRKAVHDDRIVDFHCFPYLSAYEMATVVAARAEMLAANDPPRVPITKSFNPVDLALEELVTGKLGDLYVTRNTPNGRAQTIRLSELKIKNAWLEPPD